MDNISRLDKKILNHKFEIFTQGWPNSKNKKTNFLKNIATEKDTEKDELWFYFFEDFIARKDAEHAKNCLKKRLF